MQLCALDKEENKQTKKKPRQKNPHNTPPPVTGLISSHKRLPAAAKAYVTRRGPMNCTIPPLAIVSVKVSHDWLNKNTKSVEVLASHLGHGVLPLKRGSYFSKSEWKFLTCSETSDSRCRNSENALS